MTDAPSIPYRRERRSAAEMIAAAREFLDTALLRRTVRDFSSDPVPDEVHHYYVNESVGIACGFLLAALNAAGLTTLTHTPSPMAFLREVLDRPPNEKPFVLIPVGYPAAGCRVPDISKKTLGDVMLLR